MTNIYIDVREKYEYQQSHVDGAVNIPLGVIMAGGFPTNISKEENIIVYCRSGSRSAMAKHILDQSGYKKVTNGINQEYIESKLL